MYTIWKFPLPLEDEPFIEMPRGAKVLSAQVQKGQGPMVWAIVDPEEKRKEKHWFFVHGTGHPFMGDPDEVRHIGTIQLEDGLLVFHVFDNGATAMPQSSDVKGNG